MIPYHWSLMKKLIWLKKAILSGAIWKTVTGSLIHITDALASPVNALSVNIDPVQDLHGYDNPWPGGGGKNKLPNTAQSATVNNVQYTVNAVDGTITANGTSNGWTGLVIGQCTLPAGTWFLDSGVTSGYADYYLEAKIGGSNYSTNVTGGRRQFVLSAETSVSVKLYVRSGATVTNAVCYPMIRADGAGTEYAPYSNICPISGHTSATVTRTGKNLLDENGLSLESWNKYGLPNTLKPSTTYRFSVFGETTFSYKLFMTTVATASGGTDVQLNRNYQASGYSQAFTTPANMDAYPYLKIGANGRDGGLDTTAQLQISVGTEVTDYEPYTGTAIPVSFGDAGTVYGGTLDVLSGVLTVNRVGVNLNTLTWESISMGTGVTGLISASLVDSILSIKNNSTVQDMSCSIFKTVSTNGLYATDFAIAENTNKRIVFRNGNNTTPPDALLCYPLATPQTYQLTPTEVTTLLGENNIWADTGDTTVTYMAHA